MTIVEGSCTFYFPTEAAFQEPAQPGMAATYIKYGIFSIGGHDWEIHVHPSGSGNLSFRLCLLSATNAVLDQSELWTNTADADTVTAYPTNYTLKPNVPTDIGSATIYPPFPKTDSLPMKVILRVFAAQKPEPEPAKPTNQWNPNNADISLDSGTGEITSEPGGPAGQWNPGSTDISFDTSKPTAAWDSINADISFDI